MDFRISTPSVGWRQSPLRPVLPVVVVALLIAGCGGGGDSDDDAATTTTAVDAQPYVEAVAETLAKPVSGYALDDQDAECMAEAIVAQLDLRQLEDEGVTPRELGRAADLTEFEEALQPGASEELPAGLADCNLGDGLLQTFATAFGTSAETIECIRASIDDAEVGELYASTLLTGADGEAAGQEYGEGLIAGLPGDCARTVVVALLLEGDAITEAEVPCLEQELSDDLARQMIGPEGSSPEVREGVGGLIQTCSS